MKLTRDRDDGEAPSEAVAPGTPTIAELMAAARLPGAGGDTAAASRAILEQMAGRGG